MGAHDAQAARARDGLGCALLARLEVLRVFTSQKIAGDVTAIAHHGIRVARDDGLDGFPESFRALGGRQLMTARVVALLKAASILRHRNNLSGLRCCRCGRRRVFVEVVNDGSSGRAADEIIFVSVMPVVFLTTSRSSISIHAFTFFLLRS